VVYVGEERGLEYVGPDGDSWGYSLALESIERYGLTWGEYHAMLDAQDRQCAICKRHHAIVGMLVVDHDHDSGEVRGLLCHECNIGLGKFRDRPDQLEAAIEYLMERGCEFSRAMEAEPDPDVARYCETPEQRARRLAELPLRETILELAHHARQDEPSLVKIGDVFRAFGRRWEVSERSDDDHATADISQKFRCREISEGYEPRPREQPDDTPRTT
jgi:hypothetical protein